ncbi:MAG: hypothetical protein DHS20C08_21460 [Rhodomicrobium sp.]|nr:MAG: hypothetical protein DHS20C08_21460 [Rhodomicrobium sp.]
MTDISLNYDVVIIGAGAAGMMCAVEAGRRGRSVLLIEHNKKPGEKIRISGGGRCNFTNIHTAPKNFISANPHYCISALKRYKPADFINRLETAGIAYHEKALGQLFCDGSAQQIIDLFLEDMKTASVDLKLNSRVLNISYEGGGYQLKVDLSGRERDVSAHSLVIATGGKSIPKMGASGFGYQVAQQFGLNIIEPRPGLVPLTFDDKTLASFAALSGIGVDVRAMNERASFEEALLFTHRGLSGPAILQISSYWRDGEEIRIDMLPGQDVSALLQQARDESGGRQLRSFLGQLWPKRVAEMMSARLGIDKKLAELSSKDLQRVSDEINAMIVQPMGSEGYRTAEVTIGGVDCRDLSSKTMAATKQPGLYFIGEVVDVTGWLGGYNFQWAWASGWVAGQEV